MPQTLHLYELPNVSEYHAQGLRYTLTNAVHNNLKTAVKFINAMLNGYAAK